jgi:hypothetical protein
VRRTGRYLALACWLVAACTSGPAPTPPVSDSPPPTLVATATPTGPLTSPLPTVAPPSATPIGQPSPSATPSGPTGLGWTAVALPVDPAYATVGVIDVTVRDGVFLAAGVGWRETDRIVEAHEPQFWLSPNGSDWQLVEDVDWPGGFIDTIGSWRGDYVAAGRLAGERAQAAFWTSADGRLWQQLPDHPSFEFYSDIPAGRDIVAGGVADLRVEGDELVAIGWLSCACPDEARDATIEWRTSDGLDWRRTEGPPIDFWQAPVPGGPGWLRIAPGGGAVEASADQASWTTAWAPPLGDGGSQPVAQLFALRERPGGYLAVGVLFGGGVGTPLAVSSSDGISWAQSAGWPDIDLAQGTLVDFAVSAELIVAVGPAGVPPQPFAWLHVPPAASE